MLVLKIMKRRLAACPLYFKTRGMIARILPLRFAAFVILERSAISELILRRNRAESLTAAE
jgi:hypothetical protein